MAQSGERKRTVHLGTVLRSERVTPHLQRVVLGGDGLAEVRAGEFTDHYVKLLFAPDGGDLPEPFDLERIRATLPRDRWPITRTYSVRAWDAAARELTLDFVVHGDDHDHDGGDGLAAPWATRARPGDSVRFLGPGGAYTPDPSAAWHLLAGDDSALPAIAAALERLAELDVEAPVYAFVEVPEAADRQDLLAPRSAEITWLARDGRPVGEALVKAVTALDFPPGDPHAFVHGEAHFVKELRRLLRVEHRIGRERLSISGYWRLGHNEDGWQSSKRDWNATIEAEQEPPALNAG